jgi:hypothetical protein
MTLQQDNTFLYRRSSGMEVEDWGLLHGLNPSRQYILHMDNGTLEYGGRLMNSRVA